jgi:hypothetical protein
LGPRSAGIYRSWIADAAPRSSNIPKLTNNQSTDAIDLGLDAALPPVIELERQIGEFGRGERI